MVDNALKKHDPDKMYEKINDFYRQLNEGLETGKLSDLPKIETGKISNIVLAGMGGSAIGGELLKSFLKTELKTPFVIHRNYDLPAIVNENSLLICSSYSGGTEETLSAFEAGQKIGCKILCITTGGKLGEKAKAGGYDTIIIPSGMMPRAALGYSFTPLLMAFGRMGFCCDYSDDIKACAKHLEAWSSSYSFESDTNRAYELAEKISGKLVVIYSGPDYMDAVGLRIKGQINENAKQHAFFNVFPEFNHNELVGWEYSPNITDRFIVLILRDRADHPKIAKRMDVVKKIIESKGIEAVELVSEGETLLSRMFNLIQFGDFVSYYLALINGVDPTPINVIEYMKSNLEK